MKNLFLVFFLFVQMIHGQNKRFIYQYKYVPDSTNRSNVVKELMFLDITNAKSSFYSHRKNVEDSTSIAQAKKGQFYIPNADLLYRIEKNYPDKVFFKTTDYGLGKIKVEDDRKMEWKIFPDKQKIGEYNTQKAITNFGGRQWTAWFSSDITIQDGPYKFKGLPGLIIKIEDNTHSHAFELVGVKNINSDLQYPELNPQAKVISLTQEKFIELFTNYRKDPAASTRQLYMQGKIIDQKDSSGNFRTGTEVVREVEKLTKERLKKDNNIIEIDWLQGL
ncbi:GLPGLI family protein [Chryseobacterium sp. ISL-6]|uniref:GLPGLI family protein n=1 Tax=Chryseobacterium sp. ISL-6 TaxID=2819143 RepID=UPI001BEA290E|nr:GLPGLI family protein [Chryseobacterium sp. ISL-6]MBT2622559.1 GLPGLI family protein [Chryseobacterium sp. ISL-6]